MKKATIVGCRKLSLRKHPFESPDISEEIAADVNSGTVVEVFDDEPVYNWQGRGYKKVRLANGTEGYAPEGALKMKR